MNSIVFSVLLILIEIPLICKTEDLNGINDIQNSTGAQITPELITPELITPVIQQLLSPISNQLQPFLGELGPLSNIIANAITDTVTEVVLHLLNETVSTIRKREQDNFNTILVKVPSKGRFLLISKN